MDDDDDDDEGYFDDDDDSFLQAAVAVAEQTESVLDRSSTSSKRPFDPLHSHFSSSISKKPRLTEDSDPPPNLPEFIVNDQGQYTLVTPQTPAGNVSVPGWSFQSKLHSSTPAPEGSRSRVQQTQTQSPMLQRYSSASMAPPPVAQSTVPEYGSQMSERRTGATQGVSSVLDVQSMQDEIGKLRRALQITEGVQSTKEGEIATLRRNLEQRNAEVFSEIARLKEQKVATDQHNDKSRRELEAEISRLKTRLVFKQNELEASHHRITVGSTSTQTHTVHEKEGSALKQTLATQANRFGSPKGKKTLQAATQQPSFPNFQNSFQKPSRPSPTKPSRHSKPEKTLSEAVAARQNDIIPDDTSNAVQEEMVCDAMPADIPPLTMHEPIDAGSSKKQDSRLLDREKIRRILISHCLANDGTASFQSLLFTDETGLPAIMAEDYLLQFNRVMKILVDPWIDRLPDPLPDVGFALCRIGHILSVSQKWNKLCSLLFLMANLIRAIPTFGDALLTENAGPDCSALHQFVTMISGCTEFLENDASFLDNVISPGVPDAFLTVLESVSCFVKEPLANRLVGVLQIPNFTLAICRATSPHWFLARSFRLLAVMASHQTVLGPFLLNSMCDISDHSSKSFQLPELCGLLTDSPPAQQIAVKQSVIALLASLSLLPENGVLGENNLVLAALINCLCAFTNDVWTESEVVIASSEISSQFISIIHQVVLILHLLFLPIPQAIEHSPTNRPKLRQLLFHKSPPRNATKTSGLNHLFVVAAGRLSYSVAPSWLDSKCKETLELTSELARDLLETVIDGPEDDMIWIAYNEPDDSAKGDDTEMGNVMSDADD